MNVKILPDIKYHEVTSFQYYHMLSKKMYESSDGSMDPSVNRSLCHLRLPSRSIWNQLMKSTDAFKLFGLNVKHMVPTQYVINS